MTANAPLFDPDGDRYTPSVRKDKVASILGIVILWFISPSEVSSNSAGVSRIEFILFFPVFQDHDN
jgi:hypothetical protein